MMEKQIGNIQRINCLINRHSVEIITVHIMYPRGGGGVLALEMGRGVPSACSQTDLVAIRLTAEKDTLSQFLY